jgi:hypothetical protein
VACKVIVEEFLANDLPVIAVDPQGDIASLAYLGELEEVVQRGTPEERYREFAEKAEVVVWTPGSNLGLPLSVNPLAVTSSAASQSEEEALRDRGFAAESLADLLGFDLSSSDGRSVNALFGLLLGHAAEHKQTLDGIPQLLQSLSAMPKALADRVASVVDESLIDKVTRRLRMLIMGQQRLMFTGGIPLDIDTLLGLNDPHLRDTGKTRLSVIYLNAIGSEKDRQFFLGQLAQSLYRWMLTHPSTQPQALFYVDEVAPYLPPVRKPVCKDALKLLLRQARKYGVCCLLATQSPGDLDYTALSQIGTWNLGRLMTRQEQKKVESVLQSIVPAQAEEIARELPSLRPGNFKLVCPDWFEQPVDLAVRWLITQHKTLNEQALSTATAQEVRNRIEQSFAPREPSSSAQSSNEDELGGPVRGRAEIAILTVTGQGQGAVNSCEIVVQRGGTGKITALGGQTRMAKESLKVAWEAANGLQAELKLPTQFVRRYDITVLDTRLAVQKDGPSAGLAYFIGILAALTEKTPRHDVAMTGEVTILGKVLAVGGIAEKIEAAYLAGYATVIVPEENKGDVAVLSSHIKSAIEIITISNVSEAIDVIFAAPKRQQLQPPSVPPPTPDANPNAQIDPDADAESDIDSEQPLVSGHKGDAQTSPAELVLELLRKEPIALDYEEISDRLGLTRNATTEALRQLVDNKQVCRAQKSRKAIFYYAEHPMLPQYDLFGPVEAVRLVFFEPDARKRASEYLARSMFFIQREEITHTSLIYRPLYKIHFSASVSEGWLFKRTVEKEDNLYFDALTATLLSLVKGKGFGFDVDTASNPIEVFDLDNIACLETRMPGELELDPSEMKQILDVKTVIASAKRKFALEILDSSLVFLPIWRITIADKDSASSRTLLLDGWEGRPIELPCVPRKSNRRK